MTHSNSRTNVSGLGLADQQAAIEAEASRRGWDQVDFMPDRGFSAKNLDRPSIAKALDELKAGRASILVVSKLDRLSRSLLDFATLMERARREGWEIVVLDIAIDTTQPSGQLMANVMAAFAEYERQLIGSRTSAALQQRKLQGVRLGRPVSLDASIRRRIVDARRSGKTLSSIADELNEARIPTARDGKSWYPSTVAGVMKSVELDVAS